MHHDAHLLLHRRRRPGLTCTVAADALAADPLVRCWAVPSVICSCARDDQSELLWLLLLRAKSSAGSVAVE
eukprot:39838-Eustigmatos_ZCMA.PRE.1